MLTALMTTAKTWQQRLAEIIPRSRLVLQPSVGLGMATYTCIEMQVWVGDTEFAYYQTIEDSIFKVHQEHIIGRMIGDLTARALAATQ